MYSANYTSFGTFWNENSTMIYHNFTFIKIGHKLQLSSKYNPKTFNLIYIRKFEISFSKNQRQKMWITLEFSLPFKAFMGWLLIEVAYEHIILWVLAPSTNLNITCWMKLRIFYTYFYIILTYKLLTFFLFKHPLMHY